MKRDNLSNYKKASELLTTLFEAGEMLSGKGIKVEPMADLMQNVYVNYILPVEIERAGKNEGI